MRSTLTSIIAGLAALALPVAANAQTQPTSAGCKERISQLEVFSQKLREDEKRSREQASALADSHPLVVRLSDGRIVALSGEAELSKPLESWIVAIDTQRKAEKDLTDANELLKAGNEDDCLKLLQPYEFSRG